MSDQQKTRSSLSSVKAYKMYQRATQLGLKGKHVKAAEIYEKIAQGRNPDYPRHAMFTLASQEWLFAGEIERSISLAKAIFFHMSQSGDVSELRESIFSYLNILREMGHYREADSLQEELKVTYPVIDPKSPEAASHEVLARLPNSCPSCGAALQPNTITWRDPETPICSHCQMVIPLTS